MRTALFCPFTAGTVLWQTQGGAWTLTVVVRATFSVVPGREAALSDVQEPVGGDRHYGDDARRSLYAASDLALYKPRADVLLVGSAFAADRVPVDALIARLSLGELDKSIGVVGDRTWIDGPDGPEPSAPAPFTAMPLCYERAARAKDNPLGFDLARPPAAGTLALPNLEAADDEIGRVRTIGFGPVLASAASRRGLLTPEGWAFFEGGARGPVPAGFDFAFFNAAPRDQQIDAIHAGATLALTNLNRAHARIETRLPGVRPKAFLVPADIDRGVEVALRCDTLWIDTDRAIFTLTWRGVATVASPDEEALGTLVVAAEAPGREVGYAQMAKLLRDGLNASTDGDLFSETISTPAPATRESSPAIPAVAHGRASTLVMPVAAPARASSHAIPVAPARPVNVPIPITATAPVVIEAEDSSTPLWDELSSSDLFEVTSGDEPKTLERSGAPGIDDPHTEEPSTRRLGAAASPPRRELSPADYARIAAAVERGDAARVLFGYRLTMPDLPRLTRAWTERSATDPAFAAAFAAALAEARRRP